MRKDQWRTTVTVDGIGDLGVFDTFTGGEVDSDNVTYRPGGMAPAISLGGAQVVNNVTVGRIYQQGRDNLLEPQLLAAAGRASMTVTKAPLDADGNKFAAGRVWRGRLKQVTTPEVDSNSGDAALLVLEMVPAGAVA
jgi:hypothetical protein